MLHVVGSVVAAGVGLVFNGYILLVLIWYRRIQTTNNVLLLHLAFVDALFCLVVIAFNTPIGAIATSGNGSLETECEVAGFVWTTVPVVIAWTVCGLSCDRYAAISAPLHYSRVVGPRHAAIFVLASWILGTCLAIPPLLGVCPYSFRSARWTCAATCVNSTRGELIYSAVYIFVAGAIPVGVILLCSLQIFTIAKYHRHRFVSAIYEVTLHAQATVIHQRHPCYLSKFKGRRAFFTIIQVVGSLLLLTVPNYGIILWEAVNGRQAESGVVSLTTILITCTPPINAYIYGIKSRVLRQTLKNMLRRHFNKDIGNGEMSLRRVRVASLSCGDHLTSVQNNCRT